MQKGLNDRIVEQNIASPDATDDGFELDMESTPGSGDPNYESEIIDGEFVPQVNPFKKKLIFLSCGIVLAIALGGFAYEVQKSHHKPIPELDALATAKANGTASTPAPTPVVIPQTEQEGQVLAVADTATAAATALTTAAPDQQTIANKPANTEINLPHVSPTGNPSQAAQTPPKEKQVSAVEMRVAPDPAPKTAPTARKDAASTVVVAKAVKSDVQLVKNVAPAMNDAKGTEEKQKSVKKNTSAAKAKGEGPSMEQPVANAAKSTQVAHANIVKADRVTPPVVKVIHRLMPSSQATAPMRTTNESDVLGEKSIANDVKPLVTVTADQISLQALTSDSLTISSAAGTRKYKVGEYLPAGERIIHIDPIASTIVTDKKIIRIVN